MLTSAHNILSETTKLKKELSLPNVLLVSDDINDKRSKGLNRLISSRVITGELVVKQNTISKLVQVVKSNISNNLFDYVVFKSSGLYDNSSKTIIENLSILNSICRNANSQLIIVNFPEYPYIDRSIKKYKDFNSKYLERANSWLSQSSLDTIDTSFLNQDNDYFNNNGDSLSSAGMDIIYDQLEVIFSIDKDAAEQEQPKTNLNLQPGDSDFKVYAVQKKLTKLGYDIDSNELVRKRYGKSTLAAITAFKSQNNLPDSNIIDIDTLLALKQAKVTPIDTKKTIKKLPVVVPPFVYNDAIVRNADFRSSSHDQATILLIKLEGFNAEPYWDEDNWRIGHGSSTITTADGNVIKLSNDRSNRPAYVITREDAARDLNRRLRDEFIPLKVMNVIGGVNLPNGVIAALASIAYNYGSLPASVRSAARSGDIQAIANAIRAREVDNGGINKNRRNKEANYVLASSNISEIKQQRTTVKIFDHTNPKHIAILKEELLKVRKLIKEYNENEIWNALSIDEREELLTAIDDDLGPDLANVYAEEEWKDIPEVIQSRIDLSSVPDAAKLKEPEKDAKIYFRGIVNMLKNEENKYTNVPEVLKYLKTKLNVSSDDYETVVRGLYNYLQTKTTADLMKLNIEVQEMLKTNMPYVDQNDTSNIDAWMRDLKASGEKLGD
jgi:GH24 family phage-related lysozyme (muramidase)